MVKLSFLIVNIIINTQVRRSLGEVKDGFTDQLFLSLNPPFPPVKLLEFGGCQKGNRVALELNFIIFKQMWVSDIIEDKESESEWYFIDVGTQLPFFLKSWTHIHKVKSSNGGSIISDNITFSTGFILTDLLMYPLLFTQFIYRKPVYRKLFK